MTLRRKFAILSSTGASVVNAVYQNTDRQDFNIDLVVTDRECGAACFARNNNIPLEVLEWDDPVVAGDLLLKMLELYDIDYVYVFFTRIIKGSVLTQYKERIINFHPSLLPACPGLHGFEDTLKSGSLLAGSTVHFIDDGIDSGEQIMQTFTPVFSTESAVLRHVIFSQQCTSLYFLHGKIINGFDIKLLKLKECCLGLGFCPNIDYKSMLFYSKMLLNKGDE